MRDRRQVATLVLGLLAVAACAKVAPPPGGPEDREPLALLEITPADGGWGVAADSAVTIQFSEKPDRRSVMRALEIQPPVHFGEVAWKEARLRLVPEDGWAQDRNTLIRVGAEARDPRGNSMQSAFESRFTTKDAPDSGSVAGKIWNGREIDARTTVFVAAFSASEADSLDPAVLYPEARTRVGSGGSFRLEGLDTAGSYRVVALGDRDDDARPTGEEPWATIGDVVTFREEHSIRLPDFLLGTLDSLGTLTGSVKADSGTVAIVWAETESGQPAAREVLSGGGAFSLSVPTGERYRVGAFVDTDGDSTRAEGERGAVLEEVLSLTLTAEHSGIQFDLRLPLGVDRAPPPSEEIGPGGGAP